VYKHFSYRLFRLFSVESVVFDLFQFGLTFGSLNRNVIKSFQVMSCSVVELKANALDTALSPS
jgi:hypothetical protein